MSVSITYKELSSQDELMECYELQKSIFGLNDRDAISPAYLSLLSRNTPQVGIIRGAFINTNKQSVLVGFIIAIFCKEKDSIYIPAVGVKKEHQNIGAGIGLFNKLKTEVLDWGTKKVKLIFEPLNLELAKFYFNRLFVTGVEYLITPYELENDVITTGKFLVEWKLSNNQSPQNKQIKKRKINLNKYDILKNAVTNNTYNNSHILIEVPDLNGRENLTQEKERQLELFRNQLNILVNQLKYNIVEFIDKSRNDNLKNYYLLKKTS